MRLWQKSRLRQTFIQDLGHKSNEFFYDLVQFLTACNIPLSKVSPPGFAEFCDKWIKHKLPDRTTLTKFYLPKLCESIIVKIQSEIGDHHIYLQVDESTDYQQRPMVSVLVGVLNGRDQKSYLLNLVKLDGRVDHSAICHVINESLLILWPSGIKYDRVKLLISDQAAYMLKTARKMKELLFPDLLHVTCLAHALHRVCEHIRGSYKRVDKLVTRFKRVFVKCPRRRAKLRERIGCAFVSFPVPTRWGTWLTFCKFILDNFSQIREYLSTIKQEKNSDIEPLLRKLNHPLIVDDLMKISDNLFLVDSIKKLESRSNEITDVQAIIDDCASKLKPEYQAKLNDLLDNNPAYELIVRAEDPEFRKLMRFAPLVSVDVERSFSHMKLIDTDRRQRMSNENFRSFAVAYFNQVEQ